MVSIKATFSSIEKFSSDSNNEYGAIINIATDLLSRVEHYEIAVDEEKTKITRQVARMERMYDEIQSKVRRYQAVMEKAQADQERYSDEMDYIYSHPNTVTTTDDDGNEHTESVIDYDALNAASRARDEASSTYNTYSEKYDDATFVLHEASSTLYQFQNMKRAIELTLQAIQSDKFEIKKFISAIGSEADFNLRSLQGVISSLNSYLASKAIFMPIGTRYEDFSSSATASSSVDRTSRDYSNPSEESNIKAENNTSVEKTTYPVFSGLDKTNQSYTYTTLDDGSVEKTFDHPNESARFATIDQSGACVLIDGKQYAGICALCDLTTLINRAGISASLHDVVQYAVSNGICSTYKSIEEERAPIIEALTNKLNSTTDPKVQQEIASKIIALTNISPGDVGGITPQGAMKISQHFGVSGTSCSKTFMGAKPQFLSKATLTSLATCVENGQGVYISVRAGAGSYNPNGWYNGVSGGHALVLNSVVRDEKTNKIKAFYVIDPNGETPQEASIRIPIDELSGCFNIRAFVTDKIIW